MYIFSRGVSEKSNNYEYILNIKNIENIWRKFVQNIEYIIVLDIMQWKMGGIPYERV